MRDGLILAMSKLRFFQFNSRNYNRIVEDCFRALLTIQPFVASRNDDTLFITTKAKNCATYTNERSTDDQRVFAAQNKFASNLKNRATYTNERLVDSNVNGKCSYTYDQRVFAARCCRCQLGRHCGCKGKKMALKEGILLNIYDVRID
jgi:hypothetical protein